MAAEILTPGGYNDGEALIDTTELDLWVGGSPLKRSATGVSLYLSGDGAKKLAGIAKNRRGVDEAGALQMNDTALSTTQAPQRATVIQGAAIKVRFFQGGDPLDTVPYKWPGTAHAWAVDDEIFAAADGTWDNQTAGGTTAAGRVITAPASNGDDMVVLIYNTAEAK